MLLCRQHLQQCRPLLLSRNSLSQVLKPKQPQDTHRKNLQNRMRLPLLQHLHQIAANAQCELQAGMSNWFHL